jgi:hypothetical protein
MKSRSILAFFLGTSALQAFASGQGLYTALDEGLSKVGGLCNIIPADVSCHDTGKVVRLDVGYQFSPTWGVELAYAHLAAVGAQGTTTALAPNGSTIIVPFGAFVRIRGPMLAGVATIPLGEGWSVISKGGTLRQADINVLVETSNNNGGPWSL